MPLLNVGWGPHAYFQALAERGRAAEVSTPRASGLGFRPSEVEIGYMHSEHGRDRAEDNAYDLETGRRN